MVSAAGFENARAVRMPPDLARHMMGSLYPGEDVHMVAVVVVVHDHGASG